jgi:hypothetical protein
MGYYTRYTLSVDYIQSEGSDYNDYEKQHEALLADHSEYWRMSWEDVIEKSYNDTTKWYSHQDDLIKLSEKYPLILFTLEGEGEESVDLWKTYYLNGKSQHTKAKITFDSFNKSKLE